MNVFKYFIRYVELQIFASKTSKVQPGKEEYKFHSSEKNIRKTFTQGVPAMKYGYADVIYCVHFPNKMYKWE